MPMNAIDRLYRAKTQLQAKKPFFSYLIMYMNCKENNNMETHSIGVDIRGNLYYDAKWVESLKEEELEGVLTHETLHIILQHLERGDGRNKHLFNCANDIKVNDILVAEDMKLPAGLVPNRDHTFNAGGLLLKNIDTKLSEELYDELYKHFRNKQKQPGRNGKQGQNSGSGGAGSSQDDNSTDNNENNRDNPGANSANNPEELDKKRFDDHKETGEGSGEGKKDEDKKKSKSKGGNGQDGNGKPKDGNGFGDKLTQEELKKLQDKWKKVLAEAANYARQRGLLPAGMERLVDDLLETKVDWRHKLYKYITNEIVSDYSYSRPSKKSISTGVYMPIVVKEKIEMAVSIDTSGSIDKGMLTEFLTEIVAIGRSFQNLKMHVLIGDAELHEECEVTNGNLISLLDTKMRGGGGTSHAFVKTWIEDNMPNCRLLIALTDGFSDIERVFPDIRCNKLIVMPEGRCASEEEMSKYGEVVKIDK